LRLTLQAIRAPPRRTTPMGFPSFPSARCNDLSQRTRGCMKRRKEEEQTTRRGALLIYMRIHPYSYATHTSLPRNSHATHTQLTRNSHVIHTPLPRNSHVTFPFQPAQCRCRIPSRALLSCNAVVGLAGCCAVTRAVGQRAE